MKHLATLLFLTISSLLFSQTPNPRYLTMNTVVCPLDFSKLNSLAGIIKGNKSSMKIDTTKIFIESADSTRDSSGKIIKKGTKIPQIKIDTILTAGIIISSTTRPAFDIVYQVGSFSIIKFWPIRKENEALFVNKKVILSETNYSFTGLSAKD